MTDPTLTPHVHELDNRDSDGVEVSLLWDELSNRVVVAVLDARVGESFEVPVTPADNPLDVFEHPFAYAARRGIQYIAGAPRESVYA
jgi:hypothetical protein